MNNIETLPKAQILSVPKITAFRAPHEPMMNTYNYGSYIFTPFSRPRSALTFSDTHYFRNISMKYLGPAISEKYFAPMKTQGWGPVVRRQAEKWRMILFSGDWAPRDHYRYFGGAFWMLWAIVVPFRYVTETKIEKTQFKKAWFWGF
eukprot:TRINITY_DN87_c0_g1_i1.p1 TRINITY_DN87_c0_g1~~TRINITY_DN87_c0_g1_i1.p1  ORF type:complete len:147 (+),score=19.38 TRINITY_DN87_c0_g1_i1:22-462(+)